MDIFIHIYVFTATSQQQKINYTSTMGSQRAGHDQATNTHTHTHTHTHTNTYNGIPGSYIKKKIPFALTWINLKGIMLSETNQIDKDKYYMVS